MLMLRCSARRRPCPSSIWPLDPTGLAVDGEFVSALDHVAKRVMARMAVRRTAAPRRAIEQDDADLAAREIGERLDEERLGSDRRGLGR
jgi:hypothetical protein